MRRVLIHLLVLPFAVLAQVPVADDYLSQVRSAAEGQLAGHPSLAGRNYSVSWEVMPDLVRCPVSTKVSLVKRERLWGQISVALTCPAAPAWTRVMKGYVSVPGEYWRAKTAVKSGSAFQASDWARVIGDLAQFPESVIRELANDTGVLNGFEARRAITAGRPLVLTDWKKMTVIRQGEAVKVILHGEGFDIDASGLAMNEAAVGDRVRVKTSEGKVLEGIVDAEGSVLVIFN